MNASEINAPDSFSSRLRALRKYYGDSQAAFAERFGITQSAWAGYERGARYPSVEILTRVGEIGANVDWVLMGRGEMFGGRESGFSMVTEPPAEEYMAEVSTATRAIPLLRVPLDRDGPGDGSVEVDAYAALPEFWLSNWSDTAPQLAFMVEVQGDAMSPMLEEGDLVLGELEERVERGVYAASLDGYLRVAHFFRRGDTIVMKDEYEEREVQDDPSFRLIGRVRRRLTGLR